MPIGITRNLESWRFQDHHVERMMDNAAYNAAHPDDTLVLSGPARIENADIGNSDGQSISSLLAIGMLQGVSFAQQKPTQPLMAIGSGRSFFVSGKAQGSGQMQRLFVNGRNLLRSVYHSARAAGLPVEQLDDPAARSAESNFYINLDSELYLIPFGLGCVLRNKSRQFVGGFYSELTMINSYNIGFQAGANMVAESVSFLFDRLLPFGENSVIRDGVPVATMDAVLAFTDSTNQDVIDENIGTSTVTSTL